MARQDQDHRPLSPLQAKVAAHLIERARVNGQERQIGLTPSYVMHRTNHMQPLDVQLQEREAALIRERSQQAIGDFSIEAIRDEAHRRVYEIEAPRFTMVDTLERELAARADGINLFVDNYRTDHRIRFRREGASEVSDSPEYTPWPGVESTFSWQFTNEKPPRVVAKHYEQTTQHEHDRMHEGPARLRLDFDNTGRITTLELDATRGGAEGLSKNEQFSFLGTALTNMHIYNLIRDTDERKTRRIGIRIHFSHVPGEIPSIEGFIMKPAGRIRKQLVPTPYGSYDSLLSYDTKAERFDEFWPHIKSGKGTQKEPLSLNQYQTLVTQALKLIPASTHF